MNICNQWRLNRLINPRTNRNIKPTGKVYKNLEIECGGGGGGVVVPKVPKVPKGIDYSPMCLEWHRNPDVNPITNRKIKRNGPTYQKLEKDCGSISKSIKPKPQPQPKPQTPPLSEDEECDEWKANPNINPKTGREIYSHGKIFKKYMKNCGDVEDVKKPKSLSWFTKRLDKGIRINNSLRTISSDQWNMCMSGINAPKFRENFTNIKEIGKGSFGQVYRASIITLDNDVQKTDEVVIKEAYLKPGEKRVLKALKTQNNKWDAISKNSYPQEYRILDLVNQLLLSHKCPNFVYIYNMAMCDGCKIMNVQQYSSGSCYVTFMESAKKDLALFQIWGEEQLSVLYQLLIAVYAIHKYYAIWHRDIKPSNILVQEIKAGGYFEYIIEGKTYYVKNMGIVVYLSDFGVSEVLSPLYAFKHFYGTRNAEVMTSHEEVKGSNLYWKPITIKPNRTILWNDDSGTTVKGTNNYINTPSITNTSSPIDLNNNQKFPAFEFFNDIQDVIRIFIGGDRTEQHGKHPKLHTLDDKVEQLLVEKQARVNMSSIYEIHGTVKYVLANKMLDDLYIKPSGKTSYIVDRFVM